MRSHVGVGARTRRASSSVSLPRPHVASITRSPGRARCAIMPRTAVVTRGGGSSELPKNVLEASLQARGAMTRALEAGISRQCINLLLPVNQRRDSYLATDPSAAFETSATEEFLAAEWMVRRMLSDVEGSEGETSEPYEGKERGGMDDVLSRRLDVTSSEPVGLLYSKRWKVIACVFPNAETLRELRALDADESRPLVIVNPQWNTSGNIVSDFGVGPWKRRAEEFVQKFRTTYSLTEVRVGAPASVDLRVRAQGGIVRILCCYPGNWQVYLMEEGGERCIASMERKPEYRDLENLLQLYRLSGVTRSRPIRGNVLDNLTFRSLPGAAGLPKYEAKEIDEMDKKLLYAALRMYGVPSSGKLSKLRERLKDAQAPESSLWPRKTRGASLSSPRKWPSVNGDLYAELVPGDYGAPSLESWTEMRQEYEDRAVLSSQEADTSDNYLASSTKLREKRGAPGVSTSTEHRAKISAALKGRKKGDISEAHRQNISLAARKYKEETGVWGSRKGMQKRCGYCGDVGHNRRSCPKLQRPQNSEGKASGKRCSICGASGHNKRTCPQNSALQQRTELSNKHQRQGS